MPLKAILTFLAMLPLDALIQAYPTNLSSPISANIPTNLNDSRPFDRSIGDLGSGILERNPPGWDQIPVADNALLQRYETAVGKWFSPMFYLKIDHHIIPRLDQAINPVDMTSFQEYMESRPGVNRGVRGWQRPAIPHPMFRNNWNLNEATANFAAQFVPMETIVDDLQVGHVDGPAWGQPRLADSRLSPAGANMCQIAELEQNAGQVTASYSNFYNVVDGVVAVIGAVKSRDLELVHPSYAMPRPDSWPEVTFQIWDNMHAHRRSGKPYIVPERGWTSVARFATYTNLQQMADFVNWILVGGIVGNSTIAIIK